MGQAPSSPYQYSTPLSAQTEDRSPIYRVPTHPDELVHNLIDGGLRNGLDIFARGCAISRDAAFLGTRADGDHKYQWLTYGEVETLSRLLGTALLKSSMVKLQEFPEEAYPQARRLTLLGICSKNRAEWLITEIACNTYGITLVPLYDTLGEQAMRHIVKVTRMTCVAGSEPCLLNVLKTIKDEAHSVQHLLCFDSRAPELKALCQALNVQLTFMQPLIEDAAMMDVLPIRPPLPEDVSTLCFTSGTTGVPKGAIITHRAFASTVAAAIRGPLTLPGFHIDSSDVYMSYLPLAHVLERILVNLVTAVGGKVPFYSGEASKLLDDVKLAKPTVFASVPRLFMRINDRIEAGVRSNSSTARFLFNAGINAKLKRFQATGNPTHSLWDNLVFHRVRSLLGGELRYLLCGGAALEKSVQEKMAVLFCCPFLEGYGMTETLGASFIRSPRDCLYGHVGGPLPSIEFCLESTSQYSVSATYPSPTGELLLRGPAVTPGYFLNPQATKDLFTPDGWLKTGDVAIRLADAGRVKIIDRCKDIFKLSQGEYVAPERVEEVVTQCPLISQAFVHGDDSQNYLVAIICLSEEEASRWAYDHGVISSQRSYQHQDDDEVSTNNQSPATVDHRTAKPALTSQLSSKLSSKLSGRQQSLPGEVDWVGLAQDERLKSTILREISVKSRELGLKGFEIVKNIHIETEQFSIENGLLTPTFKLKRNIFRQRYADVLQALLKSPPKS